MTPPDSGDKLRKIAAKLTERGPMPSSILTSSDKPDSGDPQHECRCGYRVVGRDAEGAHTWSECEPDSGEREVQCDAATVRRCIKPLGHYGPHDHRLDPERSEAVISQDLAQRILAALEDHKRRPCSHCRALAAELRASVERKP